MPATLLSPGTSGPGPWTEVDAASALYQSRGRIPVEVCFSATAPATTEANAFLLGADGTDAIRRESGNTAKLWARATGSQPGRIVTGTGS